MFRLQKISCKLILASSPLGQKNLHDPEGLPDSGLFAREVDINVKRQAVVSGWIKATDLVTLSVEDVAGAVFRNDDYITSKI